jgi:DNA-binding CsgD family transcriptional regulator/5-methylcytosine-specific restriction endonuclease McrA
MIADLLAQGWSPKAIADELELAGSTVSYHIERLRDPPKVRPEVVVNLDEVRKKVRTREQVADLLGQGFTRRETARRLGLSKATVSYHARRLGLPIDERGARRYDWDAVQRYYDEGHSVRDCIKTFGFDHETWNAAKKRGAVITRSQRTPTEQLFIAGRPGNRGNLKQRLISDGLRANHCEVCGLSEWRGHPLSMALHHINGDRLDNRLENLELLCPNCHSQTDTYSGRNGHRRRSDESDG